MDYFISVLIGYFLGCFQTSYLLSRIFKKADIRKKGSGNAGASNMLIVYGWKYAVITAIFDISKTVLSVCIVSGIFPGNEFLKYLTGVSCILGHIFPFYLNFRGGKGFASFLGLLIAAEPSIALIALPATALLTLLFNYIALSTVIITSSYTIYKIFTSGDIKINLTLSVLMVIILYKHKINFIRIYRGEETGMKKFLNASNDKGDNL